MGHTGLLVRNLRRRSPRKLVCYSIGQVSLNSSTRLAKGNAGLWEVHELLYRPVTHAPRGHASPSPRLHCTDPARGVRRRLGSVATKLLAQLPGPLLRYSL